MPEDLHWYNHAIIYAPDIGSFKDGNGDGIGTPMQWNSSANGGFSAAPTGQFSEGIFSYYIANVEDQREAENSLFNEIRRIISLRKNLATLFMKNLTRIDTGVKEVLGLNYEDQLLIFINFSRHPREVQLDLRLNDYNDLVDEGSYRVKARDHQLPLKAFGYRWLRKKDNL